MATLTLTIVGIAVDMAYKPADAVQLDIGGIRPAGFSVALANQTNCNLGIASSQVTINTSVVPLPIYYGASATQTPDAAEVGGWAARGQSVAEGEFTYYNIDSEYWGIAFPAEFDPPSVLYVDSMAVGMVITDLTISGVAYKLYMSPNTTLASTLTAVVP